VPLVEAGPKPCFGIISADLIGGGALQEPGKAEPNGRGRLLRYQHGCLIEWINGWLHGHRGVPVRWPYYMFVYMGLAYLCFVHIDLQRFSYFLEADYLSSWFAKPGVAAVRIRARCAIS
jgi:hypothetical protein